MLLIFLKLHYLFVLSRHAKPELSKKCFYQFLSPNAHEPGFLHSLPIFYDEQLPRSNEDLNLNVEYDSHSFRKASKLKTRVVFHVILAGYNVIWRDVDIALFKNHIVDLWSLPGDIVMQSNAPDGVPMNKRRRLNSGLYLAKAHLRVLRVLREKIIYASSAPKLSEQLCVYGILCGQQAKFCVGENSCVYGNVTTQLGNMQNPLSKRKAVFTAT